MAGVHEFVGPELEASAQRLADVEAAGRGAPLAHLFRGVVRRRARVEPPEPPVQDGRPRVQHHQPGRLLVPVRLFFPLLLS